MDKINNLKIQEMIAKIKAENPSISDEQIISILNNSLDGIKLSNSQLISIIQSNNKTETPSLENKSEQRLEALRQRIENANNEITNAEKNNGPIGNFWSLIKNTINIGDSSNDIRAAYKAESDSINKGDLKTAFIEITGEEYNEENFTKFLNGEIKTKSEIALEEYKIGQEDSSDFAGDMISGIASMGLYTLAIAAVTTMGAPIALAAGVALAGAAAIGAGVKVATKAGDAALGDKKYDTLGKDIVTGGVNGLIAPIATCFGGKIASSIVKDIKGQVFKEGTKAVAKNTTAETTENFFKSAMLNPMGNIYEGNLVQKATGYIVELGFDGGVSGGADAAVRSAYDGKSLEEIGNDALLGAGFGAFGGIALGVGMKAIGNYAHNKGVDIGNGFKGGATNLPKKINSLTDVFHKVEITNAEAIEILKKYGITEEEYLALPPHEKLNDLIRTGDFINDSDIGGCFKGKTKEEILELLSQAEEITEELKYCQFINNENIEIIAQLEKCNPEEAIKNMCDIFNSTTYSERDLCKYFELARETDYSFKDMIYYIDSPHTISAEDLKIQKKLAELSDGIFYPRNDFEISDYSKINQKFFDEYESVAKTLKEKGLYLGYNINPIAQLDELKDLLSIIDILDIDFKGLGANTNTFAEILKRHSKEDVALFINSLSDECKKLYNCDLVSRFLIYPKPKDINLKDCAELFNTMAEIKTLRENGKNNIERNNLLNLPVHSVMDLLKSGLNIKDITKLFKAYKELNWLPSSTNAFRDFQPDMDLSINVLKEVKKLCGSEYGKNLNFELFASNYFDCKLCTPESATNIAKLIENKIHIHDTHMLNTFIQHPNGIDNYVSFSKNGIILDNSSTPTKMLTDYTNEQVENCIKQLKERIYGHRNNAEFDANTVFFLTNQRYKQTQYIVNEALTTGEFNNEALIYYLYSKAEITTKLRDTEGLEEFCTQLINDKELDFPTKYISDIVSRIKSNETFDAIKQLCTDRKYSNFWDRGLPNLCGYIEPHNQALFKKLIDNPEFEYGIVHGIMKSCSTEKKTALATKLCFDEGVTLPKHEISALVTTWIEECEDVILSLCKENPLKFSSEKIHILATYLDKDTLPAFEKLCQKSDIVPNDSIVSITSHLRSKTGIDFINKALDNISEHQLEFLPNIVTSINDYNKDLADFLYFNKDRNFPIEHIDKILQYATNNINLTTKLCKDKDFPAEYIKGIILTQGIIDCPEFVDRLCFDKAIDFPKDKIAKLSNILSETHNLAIATKLCTDKSLSFEADDIIKIADYSTAETQEIIAKLCDNHNIPRKTIADATVYIKKQNIPLVEQIIATKGLNQELLPNILECTRCKDGINNGHIDEKKVKGFVNLLQNPNTSEFCVKLLNDGFDMDTVAFLCKTKRKLKTETTNQPIVQSKVAVEFSTSQLDSYEIFTSKGLNEKEASAIIKAITIDGNIDHNMQTKALSLIDQGIAKNKIGDILNQAKIDGEFTPKIVDDFVLLQNRGLNPLLEKNLAVINNISGHYTFFKFNPKVKKQMLMIISKLSDAQKTELAKIGIDTDSIIKKLEVKVENSNLGKVKVKSGLRSKASLEGFEKIIVNKYNPAENIWRNPEACKTWANDKYLEFRNHDYSSRLYPDANADRTRILNDWFEFLDNDETVKENPFAKILITEFITNNVEPENAWLPPEFDREIAKDLLSSALEDSQNISFSKVYTEKLRTKAEMGTEKEEVFIDGFKGTWYTVPQTDSSSPNFKTNVEKVKTFSDGTNWCIRTFNAAPYTQKGAMHFFVDENGLTQVCIREEGHKSVAEIQKRQQDSFRPIPYINVIQDFIKRRGLYTQRGYLDDAIAAKPTYDKIRAQLKTLMENQDYKAILEAMNIKVQVLPDGTWELSHYTPDIDQFKLGEFNIREDLLLENVSRIKGDANFNNSNATALPKLEEVEGTFTFDESQIGDVRSLKTINGKKVVWE